MILQIPVKGVFVTNCYIFADDNSRRGFIIDPGAQADVILSAVHKYGLSIEKILLTHGHFDHFGAMEELRAALGCPVMAHENGDMYLLDPTMNLSRQCGVTMTLRNTEKYSDGDVISLTAAHEYDLKVIHTPGHTPDSVVLYSKAQSVAFVGDTIFRHSIGNFTYPGGSRRDIINSITKHVLTLPDDTVLLSGHSEQTTVSEERAFHKIQ